MIILKARNRLRLICTLFLFLISWQYIIFNLKYIAISTKALNVNSNNQNFSLVYELQYSHKYDYFNIDHKENFQINITVEFESLTNQMNGTIEYFLNKNISYSELSSLLTTYITGAPKAYITNHLLGESYQTYFFDRVESEENRITKNSTYVNFWIGNSIAVIGDEEKFFVSEYPISIPVVGLPKLMRINNFWETWNFFSFNIEGIINSFYLRLQTTTVTVDINMENYYESQTKILVLSNVYYKETHPIGEETQTFNLNLINYSSSLFPSYSFENIPFLYFTILTIVGVIIVAIVFATRFIYKKLKEKYRPGEYVRIKI